jgi:hypothetical protein
MSNPGLIELFAASKSKAFHALNAGFLRQEEAQAMAKAPKPRKSNRKPLSAYAHPLTASVQVEIDGLLPSSVPQRPLRDAALAESEGEKGYSGRVSVRITSFRRRPMDPDNLTVKWYIDCLRYAGILRDDRAADIDLVTAQKKVGRKEEERTEIEVTPIAG